VNPRVATQLVGLAVELVVARGTRRVPSIRIDADPPGYALQICDEEQSAGEELTLFTRGVITPTTSCLRAASQQMGAGFEWDEARPALRLLWPASAVSVKRRH
jgi:hypothetical protein